MPSPHSIKTPPRRRSACARAAALLVSIAVPIGAPALAMASEITTDLRVALQSAMLRHVDGVLTDGAYTYLDRDTDALRTLYPANVHPMIVPVGEDFFVCAEMVDEGGETVTADFLVRRIGDNWRVVQMIVNDRASVDGLMASLER